MGEEFDLRSDSSKKVLGLEKLRGTLKLSKADVLASCICMKPGSSVDTKRC